LEGSTQACILCCSQGRACCSYASGSRDVLTEAIKHGMDQTASENKSEGVYHCVAGKSFASESHCQQSLAAVVPWCMRPCLKQNHTLEFSVFAACGMLPPFWQPTLVAATHSWQNNWHAASLTAGAISHGARQYMHLKVGLESSPATPAHLSHTSAIASAYHGSWYCVQRRAVHPAHAAALQGWQNSQSSHHGHHTAQGLTSMPCLLQVDTYHIILWKSK
jgi:hypothetical protein